MATTDFGPQPLTASQALAKLATLDPDEAHYDGNATLTIAPPAAGKPEFAAGTDTYYLNGIGNTMRDQIGQAAELASEIHGDVRLIHVATYGLSSDLEISTAEKLDPSYAFRQPPEEAVARAVLAHVDGTPAQPHFAGAVHFAAHSRGALVLERGLELAASELARDGYDASAVRALFANVGVETYGGAAASFPDGVRALHYVNDRDPVALTFGMGPITKGTVEAVAAISAFNAGAGAFVTGYEAGRILTLAPRGPVVLEPGKSEPNLVDEFLDAHAISGYLARRLPFEQERAAALGHDASAPMRVALVQREVDRLRAAGGPNLPEVASVGAARGGASSGTVVDLGGAYVAQHLGRGEYAVLDVARELGGVRPAEGVALATGDRERRDAGRSAGRD